MQSIRVIQDGFNKYLSKTPKWTFWLSANGTSSDPARDIPMDDDDPTAKVLDSQPTVELLMDKGDTIRIEVMATSGGRTALGERSIRGQDLLDLLRAEKVLHIPVTVPGANQDGYFQTILSLKRVGS